MGQTIGALVLVAALSVQSCGVAPCAHDGVGPLSVNPEGYACRHRCECNNQRYHGVCQSGRCKVIAARVACPVGQTSLEVHRSNLQVDEMCPDLTAADLQRCATGTFTKTCAGDGLSSLFWSDCRCTGTICSQEQRLCGKRCSPTAPCACVDLQRDVHHCGGCGRSCPQGYDCRKGTCLCDPPRSLCRVSTCVGGACPKTSICVDFQRDPNHCGACGQACAEGTLCVQGRCQEVRVSAGSSLRGTPHNEVDAGAYRKRYNLPHDLETAHLITLTRPFFLGRFEVSQGWFRDVVGYLPKAQLPCDGSSSHCPVHTLTLHQAMDFCHRLSLQTGKDSCYRCDKSGTPEVRCRPKAAFAGRNLYDCRGYRLPTDAEWEFAARSGSRDPFPGGAPASLPVQPDQPSTSLLAPYAWYTANAKGTLHPVGRKKPNAFGLYDMRGHVAEWVWGGAPGFLSVSLIDPLGGDATSGIVRGGSLRDGPLRLRAGARQPLSPVLANAGSSSPLPVGFRIARTADHQSLCPKSGLAACGVAGCIDTLTHRKHCGPCGRACSIFSECQGARCVRPEVLIPTQGADGKPITWTMGLNWDPAQPEHRCARQDTREHKVQFTYDFYAWPYEVQQQEFRAMLGFNPSWWPCPTCPVESVTWFQTLAFANAMSRHFGLEKCYTCTGDPKKQDELTCWLRKKFQGNGGKDYYKCPGYRLPTEAEWEYMATELDAQKPFCLKDLLRKAGDFSHEKRYLPLTYQHKKGGKPHISPVGEGVQANTAGLYNIYKNVKEWVWDAYQKEYVPSNQGNAPVVDPVGGAQQPSSLCHQCPPERDRKNVLCLACYRVFRGGHFSSGGEFFDETRRHHRHLSRLIGKPLETDLRDTDPPNNWGRFVGFRLVRTRLPRPPSRENNRP